MPMAEPFRERLDRIGMRFRGEQLTAAEALLARRGFTPDELSDLSLMTICVAVYARAESDLPAWI